MKHATNGEVLLFKRPIEQKFSLLFANMDGPNEEEVVDFEFISNPQVIDKGLKRPWIKGHNLRILLSNLQAIQSSVKSTFGYVRSRNSSGSNNSSSKQPPISRPTSSNSSSSSSNGILNTLMNNSTSCLSNGLAQGIAATLTASAVAASAAPGSNGHAGSGGGIVTSSSNSQVGNGLKEFLLEQHLVRQEPF